MGPTERSGHEGGSHSTIDLTPTLVGRLRCGDEQAAELLDQLYREKLICFCIGYVGRRDAAEDVVQDVFCRVLDSSTAPDNFRAWIYKICRNRCLDVLRSRRRHPEDATMPSGSHLGAVLTGNLTRLVRNERWQRLREIVEGLPHDQRELLQLRYAEGLSRAEIAEVLDLDEKRVKSRLYHAMEKLRLHDSLADG